MDLISRISFLYAEAYLPLLPCEYTTRRHINEPESEPLPDTESADTLISGCPVSRTNSNKFLLFM
jgi:hypothetical protein